MSKIVGIDLGTTNSCIAILEGGCPVIIANAEGFRTTPSVVAYAKNGDCLVGQTAKRQAVKNPINTFYSVKRFLGREYSEVTNEITQVPYQVFKSNNRVNIYSLAQDRIFTPEDVLATILRKLVADASIYLGEPVTQAVIAVPAYFNESQRQATRNAAYLADIKILTLINEPIAAALAYGFGNQSNETILVFDLGGGHCSISILIVNNGVFEVLAYSGSTHLGGDDFTQKIVDYLAEEFQKTENIDLRQDKQALQRLREAAEQAKVNLSSLSETEINLPYIIPESSTHFNITFTAEKFNSLCSDLINYCGTLIEKAIRDAKMSQSTIQQVILVGGSTRLPAVRELIKRVLGKEPQQRANPDEAVAIGAAIEAGILSGEVKNILQLDATYMSLGVETLDDRMIKIIPRHTAIPTDKSAVFSTSANRQTSFKIHVLQGENESVKDNKSLGIFLIQGIPAAPRGVPEIEVIFDIDCNNTLKLSAKDKKTGKKMKVTNETHGITSINSQPLGILKSQNVQQAITRNVSLYWLFSRQDIKVKLLATFASLSLIASGYLTLREISFKSVRDSTYNEIKQSFEKGEYQKVMELAQNFLTHSPFRGEDNRNQEVKDKSAESLVKLSLQQGNQLDPVLLKNYQQYMFKNSK